MTAPGKLSSAKPSSSFTEQFTSCRKPMRRSCCLYLDELSYLEMADVLGISESNVGVKLNRAKKALSELMKGESTMDPDNLQQAWQAQSSQTRVTIDADLLLKEVQRNQRDFRATIFRRDVIEVGVGLLMLPVLVL